MKSSQLVAIIRRLEAMIEAQDSEVQVRRFEKEGVEKCIVTYSLNMYKKRVSILMGEQRILELIRHFFNVSHIQQERSF